MNINDNKFGYIGNVDIKIKIGDRIINLNDHNNACEYFKLSFCKFLTGNYSGSIDIPEFIDLRKYNSLEVIDFEQKDEEIEKNTTSCLNQNVALSGKTIDVQSINGEDDIVVALFTGVIKYVDLIDMINEEDKSKFRLYIKTAFDSEVGYHHYLAYMDVTAGELSSIQPGTQAIIEWTMRMVDIV